MSSRILTVARFAALLAVLLLVACTSGSPRVWRDKEVAFADYKAFSLQRVSNDSGRGFQVDVPELLTNFLRAGFAREELPLFDGSLPNKEVLEVKTSLVYYEPCEPTYMTRFPVSEMAGKAKCTLRSRVTDLATGKVVAEISTTKVIGGCTLDPYQASEGLLEAAANDIAAELGKLFHP